jgi:hypothetical protein
VATDERTAAVRGVRRTREVIASAGPVALAFVASQHHSLHMLLLTFGLGTAGASFLTVYPAIRRSMLIVSLVVAAVLALQATRPGRARAMRLTQMLSVTTTLLLVGWSVIDSGF